MPPTASYSPLSPLNALLHAGSVWGERPAVRWDDWSVTYRELVDRCARVAGVIGEYEIEPGERVAALLPNVPELLEMDFRRRPRGRCSSPSTSASRPPSWPTSWSTATHGMPATHPSLAETVEQAVARSRIRHR